MNLTRPLLAALTMASALAEAATDLATYAATGPATALPGITKNASGLAFRPETKTLFVIINKPAQLVECTPDGRLVRTVALEGIEDPEDLAYLCSNRFALVEERKGDLLLFDLPDGATHVRRSDARVIHVEPAAGNDGLEGLAWDAAAGLFYAAKEKKPRRLYRVTPDGQVSEAWDMQRDALALGDVSGVAIAPDGQSLVLLSDQSRVAVCCTRDGRELSRLPVDLEQAEGIAFAPDGTLYICSEPNWLRTYRPPQHAVK